MILKKNPRLFAILILAVLFISLLSGNGFSDRYFVPKNFYLYFLMIPFLGAVIISGIAAKKNTLVTLSKLDVAVIIYYAYNLFQILISKNIAIYNNEFINHTFYLILYFGVRSTYKDITDEFFKKHYKTLITGILILISLNALYGLFQHLSIFLPSNKEFKIGGSFGNPGPYTNFLVMLTPFIYQVLFNKKEHTGITFFLAIIAFIFSLIILPLSQARTAWISFGLITLICLFLHLLKNKKGVSILKSHYFRIIAIILFVLLGGVVANYLFHFKKDSASGRLFIWDVTLQMIKDKPVLGHGYDSYIYQHNNYQAAYFKSHPKDIDNAYLSDNTTFAFNEFLQITSDIGVIGLLIIITLFILALSSSPSDQIKILEKKYLFISFKLSVTVFIICCLFSYPFRTVPSHALLYVALGAIAGFTNKKIKFSVILNKIQVQYFYYGLVIALLIFYANQIKKYNAEKEWFKTFNMKQTNGPSVTYKSYQELYPTMKYNKYFLFNYGAEFVVMKRFKESIPILNEALQYINDTDIYIYLGHAYDETGDLKEAEKCFKNAQYIVPSKVFPKYNLVKLYVKMNREADAISTAQEIVQMDVKIETDIALSIRHEMEEFLNTRNIQIKTHP